MTKYPSGKLNPDDQGATTIAVGSQHGNVIIAFPTPTKWIGLPPAEARKLAMSIIQHASRVERMPPEETPPDATIN